MSGSSRASLVLACVAVSAACSNSSTTTAQTEFPGGLIPASSSIDPLVELLATSPESIPHSGIRQVEIHEKVLGHSEEAIVYREAIGVDGDGAFSLIPIESVAPAGVDEELFLALQGTHAGFNFRYRDFRVRDIAAFQRGNTLLETAHRGVGVA